jgi:hypothetical protein
MRKEIDYLYCSEKCPKGQAKRDEFLKYCESAFDAAFDMRMFVKSCAETCEKCWKVVDEDKDDS